MASTPRWHFADMLRALALKRLGVSHTGFALRARLNGVDSQALRRHRFARRPAESAARRPHRLRASRSPKWGRLRDGASPTLLRSSAFSAWSSATPGFALRARLNGVDSRARDFADLASLVGDARREGLPAAADLRNADRVSPKPRRVPPDCTRDSARARPQIGSARLQRSRAIRTNEMRFPAS
jgi:hypothetical protein